jgi:hypothetical protein
MQSTTRIGIAGAAATLLLALLMILAAPSEAAVQKVKPIRATKRALVFDVKGLRSKEIKRAWVKLAGRSRMIKRRVSPTVVRRKAERNGRLRVRSGGTVSHGSLTVVISPSTPPVVTPAPQDLHVGVIANTQAWGPDTGWAQDQVAATGADWLREEFDWSVIEPRNNQWDWSRYDRVLTEASVRGMHVLPLLIDTPGWAGATWDTIPSDPSDFAQYAGKVVERYGPGGIFWQQHPELDSSVAPEYFEIWNEPFLGVFSNGDADPAKYARLVRAAARAGHATNPNAKYILAADISATDDWSSWHAWIDPMYKAVPDLGNYFDAVAVHPYAAEDPDQWHPGTDLARWETPRIEQIRREFVSHGDGEKHIWVTEMGWSTCTGDPHCVTERQQADYLARFFQQVTTQWSSYVDAVFVYHLNDLGANGGDPNDKEDWFGLTRHDGSKKPAYRVIQQVTAAQ